MELIEYSVTASSSHLVTDYSTVPHAHKARVLLTVKCLAFSFQYDALKMLLFKGGSSEPNKWSFAQAIVSENENPDDTARCLMHSSTGISNAFLEQLHTSDGLIKSPDERVVSVTYISLINGCELDEHVGNSLGYKWFQLDKLPKLRNDQRETINCAINHLRYKAALHPLLFELLPDKFTIPQVQNLYDSVYNARIDKRNFSKRLLATGLLIKTAYKNSSSKKGASYYLLNKDLYNPRSLSLIKLLPNLHTFTGR